MSYEPIPLQRRSVLSDEEALAKVEEFRDEMRQRRTVRHYDTRGVPEAFIRTAIEAAGSAPSGANQQPWHFAAICDPAMKARIRAAAEEEEKKFYAGGAPDAWIAALEPIGTGASKPHLTDAPWLIAIFAQRYGLSPDGTRIKHYYVPESVGIATGLLITALHKGGLATLTHTPNPMTFLNGLLGRPENEKPVMILTVGHAATNAMVPKAATIKKPIEEIMSAHTGGT
ncbi:MAG: nitroreductase family protein [Pseudomonadota bacterium]